MRPIALPLTIDQPMPPGAIETSTALFFHSAEPAVTTIASRTSQRREQVISLELLRHIERQRQIITRNEQTPRRQEEFITAAASSYSATSTAPDDTVRAEEPKTPADHTIAQLVRLEALDENWDGNHAAKPLRPSLKDAREFVRALAPESVMPRPALHADGHAILFLRAPNTYAELEFLGNKRIGFYARRDGREWSDEIDFDGHTLPEGLSQIGLVV
jgi:hypothetical protein